jgi:hypothetical protein
MLTVRVVKKPIPVEATQWNKNGDHPLDDIWRPFEDTGKSPTVPREGKVVRYFRRPDLTNESVCPECHDYYLNHGWIDTKEGGHRVCPTDWIITGTHGEYYPIKDKIFRDNYVDERTLPLMTDDYQRLQMRTDNLDFISIRDRLLKANVLGALHRCALIIQSVGADLDKIKKHVFYGKKVEIDCRQPFNSSIEELSDQDIRLLHSVLGLNTESAELMNMLYERVYQGKVYNDLDWANEFGDVSWYTSQGADSQGISLSQLLQLNVDKLSKRYPDKFDSERACNHDGH